MFYPFQELDQLMFYPVVKLDQLMFYPFQELSSFSRRGMIFFIVAVFWPNLTLLPFVFLNTRYI